MLFSLTSSHVSPSRQSSSSFNFLQLHKKLTSSNQNHHKRKQLSKQTLQIYQKKQPNKQLIQYCDNVIEKYQNHYNINRKYQICQLKNIQKNNLIYERRNKINNQEEQQENKKHYNYDSQTDQEKSFKLSQRSRSTMASFVNNIMKPIKINDSYKKLQPIKKQFKQNSLLSSKNILNTLLSTDKQFKIKQKIKNNQNEQNRSKKVKTAKSPNGLINLRQLQYKFRKTIWLMIQKLKQSKLSFCQLITHNIFSLQPYKFGQQIFHSVKTNNQPLTFRLIIQNKLCVFSIDTTYKTPLIWACIRGCYKIVELLISRGVDCQKKDINQMRAIEYAVKYGHDKCVKVLLLMGRNVRVDHVGEIKDISKEVKKILRVYKNNYKQLRKLNYQKKKMYFDEQYKHDLYD